MVRSEGDDAGKSPGTVPGMGTLRITAVFIIRSSAVFFSLASVNNPLLRSQVSFLFKKLTEI